MMANIGQWSDISDRMIPDVSLSTFEKILSIKVHELEDNRVGLVINGMIECDKRESNKFEQSYLHCISKGQH